MNCAEGQTRIAKAYIADCYGNLCKCFIACNNAERFILQKNVSEMLDRVKLLLSADSAKEAD